MKHAFARIAFLSTAVVVALATAPLAQTTAETSPEAVSPDAERGMSLIEQGAKILLDQFFKEAEPAMKEMQEGLSQLMQDYGPVLRDLAAMAGDLHNYHAPEKLPNGDIILRRKTPAELLQPDGPEIDL
jgi:hypothetical protein